MEVQNKTTINSFLPMLSKTGNELDVMQKIQFTEMPELLNAAIGSK